MRQLVIDTATEALSVALFDGGTCIAHAHDLIGRGHAEQLLPRIAALPSGGRADCIAVDIGPGSFTGVRVGLAAARALGFAWNAPVIGFSALAMVAHMACANHHSSDGSIPVVLNGGHGELFWQEFTPDTLEPMANPLSTPIAELASLLQASKVYGSGATALVAARGHGQALPMHPDASQFAGFPLHNILPEAKPLYGRGADAVPLKDRMARS